jgi:acetyltransferase-like isoleucine patch superfamily enzyme
MVPPPTIRARIGAASRISIGEYTPFARGATIVDHRHQVIATPALQPIDLDHLKPVAVGAGVWIGTDAIVLPGGIVAVNPARPIRAAKGAVN